MAVTEPDFDTSATNLAYVCDAFDEFEKWSAGSTGWPNVAEDFRQNVEGTWAQDSISVLENIRRGSLAAAVSPEVVRAAITPCLRQMARAAGYERVNSANPYELCRAVHAYMVAQSKSINSPGDTYDTSFSAGGGNTGDGEVIRLTVDANGNTLEGWFPDDVTLECYADATSTGNKHQELFKLTTTSALIDYLDEAGSGIENLPIRTFSAAESTTYISNPSWNTQTVDGSDVIQTLSSWTAASAFTNFEGDTTNTYRSTPGESADKALKFVSDDTIYQALTSARFDYRKPYLIDVAVRRNGSATGTVTLRLSGTVGSGGVSASVSLASFTADTWTRLRITVGANCWPENFTATDLKVQITSASLAVSDFTVDDLVIAPFVRVGGRGAPEQDGGVAVMGQYYAVLGGQTPFLKSDTFTAGDTQGGTRGVIHKWVTLVAAVGTLLSDNSGSETVSDR